MSVYVPTLSRAGWSKSPQEKVDYLLSDFFTSEYSQSYLFGGSITSLTYLIQRFQGDIPSLIDSMRDKLNSYFECYFDAAVVDITSDYNSPTNTTGNITLKIYIQVTENNKVYSVGKIVETSDGKIKKIVSLNNTGEIN